jgi:crossover junction endodeoxyribonuclease RuvC
MIVLGVDPGTQVTGYGVIRGDNASTATLVECGVIRTTPTDALPQRIREIHEGITELIERHRPGVMSIEDVFYARNVRTTVVLGHARGVILLAAAQLKSAPKPADAADGVAAALGFLMGAHLDAVRGAR